MRHSAGGGCRCTRMEEDESSNAPSQLGGQQKTKRIKRERRNDNKVASVSINSTHGGEVCAFAFGLNRLAVIRRSFYGLSALLFFLTLMHIRVVFLPCRLEAFLRAESCWCQLQLDASWAGLLRRSTATRAHIRGERGRGGGGSSSRSIGRRRHSDARWIGLASINSNRSE